MHHFGLTEFDGFNEFGLESSIDENSHVLHAVIQDGKSKRLSEIYFEGG